ncbi:MAG: hypothetical protein H7A40_06075 [Chlamydiales bacterium]|nr:hypothetical protein [Chlamydiales bacterium]
MLTACTNFVVRAVRLTASVWNELISEPTVGESACKCFRNIKIGFQNGLRDFSFGQVVVLGACATAAASAVVIAACVLYQKGSKKADSKGLTA